MSQDIRSFFGAGASKKKAQTPAKAPESPAVKRKALVISSDEDEVPKTPIEKPAKSVKNHRKKRRISDSDEDVPVAAKESPSSKKPNLKKLSSTTAKKDEPKKAVDPSALFGGEPTRVERPKPKKPVVNDALLLDDDFDTSIAGLDESQLFESVPDRGEKKTELKEVKSEAKKEPSPKKMSPRKESPADESKPHKRELKTSPLSEFGLNDTSDVNSPVVNTPKSRAAQKVDLDASVMADENRQERKRMAAILYQKFKNRQSVLNPGSKEVPKGKPNCLAGLTFLVTGILESLEREECQTVIKDLGGKVSSTVGKRLNYMVVGEEAGPKKLATAEELGVKIISEDELFDLIREKSGQVDANKNATNASPKKEVKKEKKHSSVDEKKKIKSELHDADESPTGSKRKAHEDVKMKVKEEKTSPPKKVKEEKMSPAKKVKTETITSIPQESKSPTTECSEDNMAWVDKYKPSSVKQIIGQQGAASNCVKLMNWLSKWHSSHDGKKKPQRPNPWAKNDDGSFYKAALLSGPPGVGKTTTVSLVCQELGFDTIEFNASDTRSKKLLKQEVSELLNNNSLYGYFHGEKKVASKNHVLIMDEVDGMAGNEDRGGVQELIGLIKDTSVPVICMCNDRNHQKMRSLVNYCYDLRFNKPRVEQIKGAMMSVCFKEKFKITPAKLEEIIAATNNDIRQTLNHLSLLSAGKELELSQTKTGDNTARKDLKIGPWEVVRKVFSHDEHKHMTLNDRADLFFHDYSFGPLFVQENYLSVLPKVPKTQIPQQVALAANSLSLGDMIDRRIRSSQAWSLLPVQAMFSSVMPGQFMSGHFTGQINFPGWLGKNSKRNKRSRMAQELHDHTRIRTSGSKLSIRMDYAPFLLDAIVRPLKTKGMEGVGEALEVIKEYRLLRDDLESLIELSTWPGKKSPMDAIDGKVKAALTRSYNKDVLAYSYSAMAGVKKKRADAQDDLETLEDGEDECVVIDDEEDGEDDKVENDALIKAKKKPAGKATSKGEPKKATAATSKATAGTSKATAGSSKAKAGGRSKK